MNVGRHIISNDSPRDEIRRIIISMSWDANDVALLKKLWAEGHSAGQIASRLGHSRNAVSAKLKRLGHKRGHKPPTASPRIVSVPTRKPKLAAACAQPVDRVVSKPRPVARPVETPTKDFTKRELYAMLADAVRNTG
jgi:GcrA cell cycle regulator